MRVIPWVQFREHTQPLCWVRIIKTFVFTSASTLSISLLRQPLNRGVFLLLVSNSGILSRVGGSELDMWRDVVVLLPAGWSCYLRSSYGREAWGWWCFNHLEASLCSEERRFEIRLLCWYLMLYCWTLSWMGQTNTWNVMKSQMVSVGYLEAV